MRKIKESNLPPVGSDLRKKVVEIMGNLIELRNLQELAQMHYPEFFEYIESFKTMSDIEDMRDELGVWEQKIVRF